MRFVSADPLTFWFTGLPGSGKSTLAVAMEHALSRSRRACLVLDGDVMRTGLSRDLGFSAEDRRENIRRIAEVCRLFNSADVIVIAALISPLRSDRAMAKEIIGHERFVEIFLSTPLAVCETRDPKGHYRKARRGEIPQFTGVSAPYEAPESPALAIDTSHRSVDDCVGMILATVEGRLGLPAAQ